MSLNKIEKILEIDEDVKSVVFDLSEKIDKLIEPSKGDKGEPGRDGKDGATGRPGLNGKDGVDGRDGKDGKDGLDGLVGLQGEPGKDGLDGKDGSPDTGEEIVNKINSLQIKPEFQIDAKHIKNLPISEVIRVGGGGGLDKTEVLQVINGYFADDETPAGDINGSNTDFVLSKFPVNGTLKVYVNGSRMRLTEDYTLNEKTISFITPPPTTSIIICDYRYV